MATRYLLYMSVFFLRMLLACLFISSILADEESFTVTDA
jgi:hypothetical protein